MGRSGRKSFTLYDAVGEATIEAYYRELALESCISLIANAVSLCEFQTYSEGKKIKGSNYYLFNVRPNVNQSAGKFIHALVSKLIRENECLVIMYGDSLYLADDYDIEEFALYENQYKNVKIGDFTFTQKTFAESEVFHFVLNDENVSKIIRGLNESYSKLLASAQDFYKRKNNVRIVLDLSTLSSQDEESKKALDDLFNNQFQTWFDSSKAGAVLPLTKGMDIKDWSEKGYNGSSANTRDIRALIDDIFDFTSTGLHVPKGLAKGETVSVGEQVDSLIMFAINPIVKILQSEIMAKMYSKSDFLKKSYVRIDTSKIKLIDINKLAIAADKLFASGINTINDNLEMLGREPIEEEWANERFVTKNYEAVNIRTKEGGK